MPPVERTRQQSTETKHDQLRDTLRTMQRVRIPITYPAVAQRSGVSRTVPYQNADAKTLMTAAVAAWGLTDETRSLSESSKLVLDPRGPGRRAQFVLVFLLPP